MYKSKIKRLVDESPLEIDTGIQVSGHPPTMANSEFLTKKEQGDWAEQIVYKAINENSAEYTAVKYGQSETIAAGSPGFSGFYTQYQQDLNIIGKKPDLLIFKRSDFPNENMDVSNDNHVKKAVAAIEVRSSSFLVEKYNGFILGRQKEAISKCEGLKTKILQEPYHSLLKRKNKNIFEMLLNTEPDQFRDLDFRLPSWSVTEELRNLKELLRKLKENIRILHRRDYLSFTPKMEDIALVNRWIQIYNVKHYYLQVFFDKAYVISFKKVLELICNDENEESYFSIEKDVKNQQKTTIKVNIQAGKEILGRIDMPNHLSSLKELDRGRLLFYVSFDGGKGYLDKEIFLRDVIHA